MKAEKKEGRGEGGRERGGREEKEVINIDFGMSSSHIEVSRMVLMATSVSSNIS